MITGILCLFIFSSQVCWQPISREFVIVANGSTSCVDEEFMRQEVEGKTLLALDGGSNFLKTINIAPHVRLGDFDSVDSSIIQNGFDAITEASEPYMQGNTLIVPAKDQNKTDLEKGIEFCDKHHANNIIVYNAIGNREDHTEWNKQLLKKYYNPSRGLFLRCQTQTLTYIERGSTPYRFSGSIDDKCGYMAWPNSTNVSTKGFKCDAENYQVTFADKTSVCNSLIEQTAEINIHNKDGGLLVIQPNSKLNHSS